MKRFPNVLFLVFALFGAFTLTGCGGGSSSAALLGAEQEAALDSGAVVEAFRLFSIDSTGERGYDLKAIVRKDPLTGKATITTKGDTALKVMQVSSSVDTSSSGTVYLYVWIEGRFGSLEPSSSSPIERGVPSHARVSPEGSAFQYQLTHTTEEQRTSDLIGTTTLLVGGILREAVPSRWQSVWDNTNTWTLSIRFVYTPIPTPPLPPVCCSEKG